MSLFLINFHFFTYLTENCSLILEIDKHERHIFIFYWRSKIFLIKKFRFLKGFRKLSLIFKKNIRECAKKNPHCKKKNNKK